LQREYDAACTWAKQTRDALNKVQAPPPTPLVRADLPSPPDVSDASLNGMLRGFETQFRFFETEIAAFIQVRKASEATAAERAFVNLSPFLLALGLALRITKVTGEI
jgi:hypothetical protein